MLTLSASRQASAPDPECLPGQQQFLVRQPDRQGTKALLTTFRTSVKSG